MWFDRSDWIWLITIDLRFWLLHQKRRQNGQVAMCLCCFVWSCFFFCFLVCENDKFDSQPDMHFIKLCSYKLKLKWNDDARAATVIYSMWMWMWMWMGGCECECGQVRVDNRRKLPFSPLPRSPGCKNLLAKQQVEHSQSSNSLKNNLNCHCKVWAKSPVSQGMGH